MEDRKSITYQNEKKYQVKVLLSRDVSSKRLSLEIYTVSPEGAMSDPQTIRRGEVFRKATFADFLMDMEGDFTRDDIDKIEEKVKELLASDSKPIDVGVKATMKELYEAVCRYIVRKTKEDESGDKTKVFIKSGYGYIKTTAFPEFVKLHGEELGFSRKEILKRLKIMQVLQAGNNRPYDITVNINGHRSKYYKLKLCDGWENEPEQEADEIIDEEKICLE